MTTLLVLIVFTRARWQFPVRLISKPQIYIAVAVSKYRPGYGFERSLCQSQMKYIMMESIRQ
jgi:hypothetical protein